MTYFPLETLFVGHGENIVRSYSELETLVSGFVAKQKEGVVTRTRSQRRFEVGELRELTVSEGGGGDRDRLLPTSPEFRWPQGGLVSYSPPATAGEDAAGSFPTDHLGALWQLPAPGGMVSYSPPVTSGKNVAVKYSEDFVASWWHAPDSSGEDVCHSSVAWDEGVTRRLLNTFLDNFVDVTIEKNGGKVLWSTSDLDVIGLVKRNITPISMVTQDNQVDDSIAECEEYSKVIYASSLCDAGLCENGLDEIYDCIDDLLLSNKYQILDEIFAGLQVRNLNKNVIVALVKTTKYAKSKIRSREKFVESAKKYFMAIDEYNEVYFS